MPISKRLASASQADKNNVNAHSGIKAMLESVTHLLFFTHTPPLMFILFMDKANEHQRWSERLERGLSGDFLKAEGWSITSTFSNSTGLSPTWLVFLLFQKRTKNAQTPGLIERRLMSNQRALRLFFWKYLVISSLCFTSVSAHYFLTLQPPSFTVIAVCGKTAHSSALLCYSTPLHACTVCLPALLPELEER